MSKTNLCLAILALGVAIGFAATARAEKRVALLVGNNAYQNVPRLQTAVNDARAVGTALRGLGFSGCSGRHRSDRLQVKAARPLANEMSTNTSRTMTFGRKRSREWTYESVAAQRSWSCDVRKYATHVTMGLAA